MSTEFRLTIIRPNGSSQKFRLERDVVLVGRESGDLVTHDPDCSARHAEIRLAQPGNRVLVSDLGSTNGTFLNEKRQAEFVLSPGQHFRVGSCSVRLDNAPAGPMPAASTPAVPAPAVPEPPPPTPAVPVGPSVNTTVFAPGGIGSLVPHRGAVLAARTRRGTMEQVRAAAQASRPTAADGLSTAPLSSAGPTGAAADITAVLSAPPAQTAREPSATRSRPTPNDPATQSAIEFEHAPAQTGDDPSDARQTERLAHATTAPARAAAYPVQILLSGRVTSTISIVDAHQRALFSATHSPRRQFRETVRITDGEGVEYSVTSRRGGSLVSYEIRDESGNKLVEARGRNAQSWFAAPRWSFHTNDGTEIGRIVAKRTRLRLAVLVARKLTGGILAHFLADNVGQPSITIRQGDRPVLELLQQGGLLTKSGRLEKLGEFDSDTHERLILAATVMLARWLIV